MSRLLALLATAMQRAGRPFFRELIRAMCAEDADILNHVRIQHVILRAEQYVSRLPLFYLCLFNVALLLFEYALPPLSWKIRPFSKMPLERKLAYMREWQSSRFYYKRMLFKMIQSLSVAHIYSERSLMERLGYGASLAHRGGE